MPRRDPYRMRMHCDCNDCEEERRERLAHPADCGEPPPGPGWGAGRRGVTELVAAARNYAVAAAFRDQADDCPEGPDERRASADGALRRLGVVAWAWSGRIAAAPVACETPGPHWSAADRAVRELAAAALAVAAAAGGPAADRARALRSLGRTARERYPALSGVELRYEQAPPPGGMRGEYAALGEPYGADD